MMKNRLLLILLVTLIVFTFGCQRIITTASTTLVTTTTASTTLVTTTISPTTTVTTTTSQDMISTTIDLYDYSDFSVLFLTDPQTQLSQEEDDYYLYFFGPNCLSCNEIKQEVLSIIDNLTGTKVYLIETHVLEDINENISISHTPSIVHVVNNLVESAFEGATDVLAIFQIME